MEAREAGAATATPGHEVERVLAEAPSLREAAERLVELAGRQFGWPAGTLWVAAGDGRRLNPAGSWCGEMPEEACAAFRRLAEHLTFEAGIGLPGEVWARGVPVSISDVAAHAGAPRSAELLAVGLRAAVAVPVEGPGGAVIGVLELFGPQARAAGGQELAGLTALARQAGQYVSRVRAEERLRLSEEVSASIVRSALDCIVTMDHEGYVIDFNPAAEATFGYQREEAVGRLLAELIIPPELRAAHHTALAHYVTTGEASILNQRLELTAMRADGTTIPVELTITRLGTADPPVFTGFLRDITDRRRIDDEVTRLLKLERDARLRAERAERSTRSIANALQRSLLPPHMPDIPKVELGAAYRPAIEGSLVGGDFYDVFKLGINRWGIAIGDVRGKGVDAASVTALMRYTIRTAAVREAQASAVLGVLNQALLRNPENGDYCTAIYASLDVSGAEPCLQLAVAGHPLPLVLQARGEVRTAGVPGTLLGAVPEPAITDVELSLAAGDLLLLYTDGVIESRTAEGLMGTDRLGDLLSGLAGLDAETVARRIQAAVVDDPHHRVTDDVALLAVRALEA